MTLFIGNVNRNAWTQGPKAAIMPVCNLAILDLVNLVVKWWKFGVIVASHSFMSNVDPGLQPVKLKNWLCLAAKINVPNLYHVGIGMNFKNIINSVLNGWPNREHCSILKFGASEAEKLAMSCCKDISIYEITYFERRILLFEMIS